MKAFLKNIAVVSGILFVIFLFYFLIAIAYWWNGPRESDFRITYQIHDQLIPILETNFQKHIDVIVQPSNKRTWVFVKSVLSEKEKQTLNSIVKDVSLNNSNRLIYIKYEQNSEIIVVGN